MKTEFWTNSQTHRDAARFDMQTSPRRAPRSAHEPSGLEPAGPSLLPQADRGEPLIGGHELWRALGYRNADAFRKAGQRGTLPVRVFAIPGRRGKFAMTSEVYTWLLALSRNR